LRGVTKGPEKQPHNRRPDAPRNAAVDDSGGSCRKIPISLTMGFDQAGSQRRCGTTNLGSRGFADTDGEVGIGKSSSEKKTLRRVRF